MSSSRSISLALASAQRRASEGEDVILLIDSLTRFTESWGDTDAAKELFDKLHRQSVVLLCVRVCLLLGMILFSANITPAWWR